jgi:hypothetical protein
VANRKYVTVDLPEPLAGLKLKIDPEGKFLIVTAPATQGRFAVTEVLNRSKGQNHVFVSVDRGHGWQHRNDEA